MPRKKVDNRIKTLIENGVALRQRTIFLIVGTKGRDQVKIYFMILCVFIILNRSFFFIIFSLRLLYNRVPMCFGVIRKTLDLVLIGKNV